VLIVYSGGRRKTGARPGAVILGLGLDLAVLVQGRLIAGPDANGASCLLANYEKDRL
jgi:hypothetical protein